MLSCLAISAWAAQPAKEPPLPEPFAKLVPLHKRLTRPQPGDWLAEHPEPGQTYQEYLRANPLKPDPTRRTLYVQPLGSFTPTQRKIVEKTARYMEVYFSLPVRVREPLSLSLIPASARRKHPVWKDDQVLSTYVLESVLIPRLPKDAAAYIAFTTSDLWPGEGWNFVFGQASLEDRVGLWSIYRYGDPDQSEQSYRRCLLRTMKVGSHETGHMFSMAHCTAYQCAMGGSNHLAEMDRRPTWLCPECLAKLSWATGADPAKRFERLIAFAKENGLKPEQEFYEKSLAALGAR
jgi:archaemetzincin